MKYGYTVCRRATAGFCRPRLEVSRAVPAGLSKVRAQDQGYRRGSIALKRSTFAQVTEVMPDLCEVCSKPVRGGFDVYEQEDWDGTPMIVVDSTPDRDYNVCDLCNKIVHFRCSAFPDDGYCDECYDKCFRKPKQPSNQ